MGCNSCRSACEDCSEGGITFRRSVRVVAGAVPALSVGLTPADVRPSAVADLGSDPNSVSRTVNRKRSFPELGPDHNSADHRDNTSNRFSPSSPYEECADSYVTDNNPSLDPINRSSAEIRRIGVRAQFEDASATNSTTVGRIGIRPQICYAAREFEAGLKSRLIDDAVVPLTPGAAA